MTPKALPATSATSSSVLCRAMTPSPADPSLPQDVGAAEGGSDAVVPQPASPSSMLQRQSAAPVLLQELMQRVGRLEQELAAAKEGLAAAKEELTEVKHANSQLQRQVSTTNAACIRLTDRVVAAEQQIAELMAASMQQAEDRDNISKLHSRQEQLLQQQQIGACQLSVVYKSATLLPTHGAADQLQQVLNKHLRLNITVQRVQPLGSQHNSNSNAQRRHAYKVTLGSPGERTAVLRAKAQGLRGSDMSIDALLTPEQLASRQRLQPVARQAKAAGQAVRWRYGTLFIDGQQYTGPGSLPTPAQQQAALGGSQLRTQAPSPPANEQAGWQMVQRKQPKPKEQPAAAATGSKKGPKQQQIGGTAKGSALSNAPSAGAAKQQYKGATAKAGVTNRGAAKASGPKQQQKGSHNQEAAARPSSAAAGTHTPAGDGVDATAESGSSQPPVMVASYAAAARSAPPSSPNRA